MEKLRQLPVHNISLSGTWKTGSVCDCKSHIVDNMILLCDWYLIKSPKAHMGKRLAVGGISSKGDQDVKKFQSAPIVQRLNAVRLRTADGLIILLIGLIDGQRTSENGFPSEALSYFQIGFPFTWDTLANVYISSDDTSCSSSGHDNDANELVHSVGRARRVRIFSDDEKWNKSDSASGPENDRSMHSSFARKTEDKSGSFLKVPALHMGSNLKNFSPSDAWKRKDKGTVHKDNISSSVSTLGNIQKFDDDGKIGPIDGDRCVRNCLDEVIPNQTLLDTSTSISVSMSYKNRGTQPGHECQHVNSDMEKNTACGSSQMKSTGNKDCNILSKPPECSRDMLNATNPMENLGGGNSTVCKGPGIQNVSCPDIMYLTESGIVMPWATTFKCAPAGSVPNPVVVTHKKVPCQPAKDTSIDSKHGVFLGNSFGERIADAAKLVIGGCTMISNSKTVKDKYVESENGTLFGSPVKKTKACQLGLSEEQSQRDA